MTSFSQQQLTCNPLNFYYRIMPLFQTMCTTRCTFPLHNKLHKLTELYYPPFPMYMAHFLKEGRGRGEVWAKLITKSEIRKICKSFERHVVYELNWAKLSWANPKLSWSAIRGNHLTFPTPLPPWQHPTNLADHAKLLLISLRCSTL